jgi:hypothetical protein
VLGLVAVLRPTALTTLLPGGMSTTTPWPNVTLIGVLEVLTLMPPA